MPEAENLGTGTGGRRREFVTTLWTQIIERARSSSPEGVKALNKLCEIYWYPLYVFARRRPLSHEDGEDSVQAFFEDLFSRDSLSKVSRHKGKFRTFLLTAFVYFLNKEWRKRRAKKERPEGGLVPLDMSAGEDWFKHEPVDSVTAEKLYERACARRVLEEGLERLRARSESVGNLALFEALRPLLSSPRAEAGEIAPIAKALGMQEGAVRAALSRLRALYGACIREVVAGTVTNPMDVDDEIKGLFDSFDD